MRTPIYQLYPSGSLSIARADAHQFLANISLPISSPIRTSIEDDLTSFNSRMTSLLSPLASIDPSSRIRQGEDRSRRTGREESDAFVPGGKMI